MSDPLPSQPNFKAIEAVSHKSADRRTAILALIGNIGFTWSNNESMFIYILKLLLGTDQKCAAVVFATLNTTRARLDLVERLATLRITDKAMAKELDRIISRFNDGTRVRNEFNHCTYTLNDSGEITHTYSIRIQDVRGQLRLGYTKKMDNARIQQMIKTIKDLRQLNRDLWSFIERLQSHLTAARGEGELSEKAAKTAKG